MNKNIFISSTVHDLIDVRAEIENFLRNEGVAPVLSDSKHDGFETISQTNSIETCLINLRKCDIVVLILSQRYGPTLSKSGFSDHSATHLEYLEAKKCGKKIIVYARDQLFAEYNIWKRAADKSSLRFKWVNKSDDFRLFEILDDRCALKPESDNWINVFSNSVDIKQQLKRDLKIWMDNVTFWDDLTFEKVPILFGLSDESTIQPMNPNIWVTFKFKNCGNVSAHDISIIYENGTMTHSYPTLPCGEIIAQSYVLNGGQNVNYNRKIEIKYMDAKGRKYSEIYQICINGQYPNFYTSLSHKERKFYDMNGLERKKDA